jgi:hypothetical protein
MRIIETLCVAVVGLVSLGLDIVGFFVLVRLITLRWPVRPLLAFDHVGQPLVDWLVHAVQRAIPEDWARSERRRTVLATAATLLTVTLCRLAIKGVTNVAIIPW